LILGPWCANEGEDLNHHLMGD